MSRLGRAAAILALLGIVQLAPEAGAGLFLRLAAATLAVLLPGALLARALGQTGGSAVLAWGLALVAAALAITFAVHGSLTLTLLLVGASGLAALVPALLRRRPRAVPGTRATLLAGACFGGALWFVAGTIGGDALFHLARVRKLDAFGSLSLHAVDEFRDGGLHPGYAFPLWHGFLALVARLAGVDPTALIHHEASVLAPLAFLVAYEAGVAVFRSAWLGAATVAAQVALIALAPGHGGAYTALALPATASRQLLVPAVLALYFGQLAEPGRARTAAVAAAALALVLVHPTYALFVLVPLGGYVVVRALAERSDLAAGLAGLGAVALPTGAVLAWLAPIVAQTVSHDPSAHEKARAIHHYGNELVVRSPSSYHLAAEVFGRAGSVAVAALALVPLAALAWRRRWAALVLGGSLAILALELIPFVFTRFSDAVSLSQSRRAAGFLPFAFAFAGGWAVLARPLRLALPALALAAGVALELAYPGDFGYGLAAGGPAVATWIAAFGGAAALVAVALLRPRGRVERRGPLAALAAGLFVLPVAVSGFAHWSAADRADRNALTPGLVRALRTRVPHRAVVFSDLETSYRIAAYAPVYIVAAPPAHVADTTANRPYARRRLVLRFFRTGNLAIPGREGAGWLVVDRQRYRLRPGFAPAYADARYSLYRLPGSPRSRS